MGIHANVNKQSVGTLGVETSSFVLLCVYTHRYTYTNTHAQIKKKTCHTQMHTDTHRQKRMHKQTKSQNTYANTYTNAFANVFIHRHVHTRTFNSYRHIHTYTHKRIHAHTHIRICMFTRSVSVIVGVFLLFFARSVVSIGRGYFLYFFKIKNTRNVTERTLGRVRTPTKRCQDES